MPPTRPESALDQWAAQLMATVSQTGAFLQGQLDPWVKEVNRFFHGAVSAEGREPFPAPPLQAHIQKTQDEQPAEKRCAHLEYFIPKVSYQNIALVPGAEFKVPGWEWVNHSGSSDYADSCGIQYDGTLKVLRVEGDQVEAHYTFSGDTRGTPCESGIEIKISREALMDYPRAYAYAKAEKQRANKLTNSFLSGNACVEQYENLQVGKEYSSPRWAWMELRQSMANVYSNGTFMEGVGDSCGTEGVLGASITILGFDPIRKRALIRYHRPDVGPGTPCEDGAVGFIDLTALKSATNKNRDRP